MSPRPPACGSVRLPVTQTSGITRNDDGPTVRVYDLSVDADDGEFFANGILVHNCKVHHVGTFPKLEDQLTQWNPLVDSYSPDRLDALVWLLTELLVDAPGMSIFDVL